MSRSHYYTFKLFNGQVLTGVLARSAREAAKLCGIDWEDVELGMIAIEVLK